MPSAPAYVLDALNGLLEAEQGSVFRTLAGCCSHTSRDLAALRQPLAAMADTSRLHAHELASLISNLGGSPSPRGTTNREAQYIAYLSLKFLLPRLATEMQLMIQRYENAQKAIGKTTPPATALLDQQLTTLHQQLQTLRSGSPRPTPTPTPTKA